MTTLAERIADLKSAQTVVDAIRLAIEGAATPETALEVIESLLHDAPPTDPSDTESPKLLLQTIQALGGTFAVNQTETDRS